MAAANIPIPEDIKERYQSFPTEEMTVGRAAKNAVMDTIGMTVDPSSAVLNLTKKQMLQELGRGASKILQQSKRWRDYNLNEVITDPVAASEYKVKRRSITLEDKSRAKTLAKEIRSAPEGIFDPVDELSIDLGSSWQPAERKIILDRDYNPKHLRHELTHAWADSNPDLVHGKQKLRSYQSEYADASMYPENAENYSHDLLARSTPFVRDIEDLTYGHGFSPHELTAINQEYIPFAKHKSLKDYQQSLRQSAEDALEESMRRKAKILYGEAVFERLPANRGAANPVREYVDFGGSQGGFDAMQDMLDDTIISLPDDMYRSAKPRIR